MPIRDAILQLVREGYLVRGRGDGIAVAPLTIDEVKDMFRIEGMLVGYAARLACERATDEEIEDLWVLHERMKQEVSNKDFASAAQTNLKLHQGLNHLAKSRRLTSTIRHVSMRLHREFLIEFPEWITRSLADHERILSLLAQRNGAEVEVLMIDHICASGEEVVRSLAQNMEARRSKEAQ
jgi:DNA-binding GntR family transcriptional regulator